MSYVTEIFMNRQIAQAADALDLIEACKAHKLASDSGKLKLLADQMKRAANRFNALVGNQSVMTEEEFFAKALARAAVIKKERAILMQMRREKREREAAEREALQAELALIAA
jgi:uncharacterized membrane protein